MFSFNERVHTEKFQEVLKKGRTSHSSFFSICFLKAENKAFSVVASKKVSKLATVRNRNKRRVRPMLKKLSPTLPNGLYIVFMKRDISKTPHQALFEDLALLASKI